MPFDDHSKSTTREWKATDRWHTATRWSYTPLFPSPPTAWTSSVMSEAFLLLFFCFTFFCLIFSSQTLISSRVWQLSHCNRRNEEQRIMAQKWHTAPRRPRGALRAAVTQPIWTLGASDNWIAHENANMRTNNLEWTTCGRGAGRDWYMDKTQKMWGNQRRGQWMGGNQRSWQSLGPNVWSEIINWGWRCFYLHVNHLFFHWLGGEKLFDMLFAWAFAISWKIGLSTCTWKNMP